jgi:XTP/dITP diphosphohydrolase
MIRLLLATNNPGKLHELVPLLSDLPLHIVTPHALGLHLDVEETGTTYAENARVKAVAFAHVSGLLTLADDSGLEVDALSGAPGIYSARYAGEGVPLNWRPSADAVAGNEASDTDRRAKLIHVLRQVPAPRPARFRCVIAIAQPGGAIDYFEGVCAGEIILEERGASGFGYDPVFYLPEHGCTMAELPSAVKNQMSHRARAAQAARLFLHKLATNR